MGYILGYIVHFFYRIYQADKRPEARRFTIGCFLITLVALGILCLIFWNSRLGE